MNSTLKRLSLAALAAIVLSEAPAYAAGDIKVVNSANALIHPYFKSNCWVPGFNGGDDGPNTWVFFGGVGPMSQFTWNDFYVILDPQCRNPVVKFTFTRGNEAAPTSTVPERTTTIVYDATQNYSIGLGNPVIVIDAP